VAGTGPTVTAAPAFANEKLAPQRGDDGPASRRALGRRSHNWSRAGTGGRFDALRSSFELNIVAGSCSPTLNSRGRVAYLCVGPPVDQGTAGGASVTRTRTVGREPWTLWMKPGRPRRAALPALEIDQSLVLPSRSAVHRADWNPARAKGLFPPSNFTSTLPRGPATALLWRAFYTLLSATQGYIVPATCMMDTPVGGSLRGEHGDVRYASARWPVERYPKLAGALPWNTCLARASPVWL
jgi:hypothetical protein